MTALEQAGAHGLRAVAESVLGAHFPWCDPPECTRFGIGFHPNNRPLAHLSRRYDCNLGDGSQVVGIVAQLVRYVQDPRPHRYLVRLEISEPDERSVVYIELDQGAALAAALTAIAALPDTIRAPDGPPEPGVSRSGQAPAERVGELAEPSDPTPAPAGPHTATVKDIPR